MSTTSIFACAATMAMPPPMSPAPSMPMRVCLRFGTPAGRRTSLSAFDLFTNSVRSMLPDTGSASSCAMYLASSRSAVSMGNCAPSYMHDKIAKGAG